MVAQLGSPAGWLAVAPGWDASLTSFADPLAYRASGDTQGRSHILLFPTLLDQLPSPQPAGFLPIAGGSIIRYIHAVDCLTCPVVRSLDNHSRISSTNVVSDDLPNPDGTVTFTVLPGSGYTISPSAGAASVTVYDDDAPRVSISPVSVSVTEGGVTAFTLTASPVPTSPLRVGVTVTQRGDFGASPTGRRTVTVPTGGSGTLMVGTKDDNVDEPDGAVIATVNTGSGYNVSASSGATQVTVEDDETDIVPCTTPTGTTDDGDSFGGVIPDVFCLDIGLRYNEDETNPADAYDLFYGGTTTPLPDLVRRPGDLYAQRLIYDNPVGPDGNDRNLARWNYAHEVCADEGFDCTWTRYRKTVQDEPYTIAQDLVIRCAEGFRCSINFSAQRHSSTSTVRAPAEPVDPPLRPRNEPVVSEAEGRQIYRIRYNNNGNARDEARYTAVYEAVCSGHYGGAGVVCEWIDHYLNDHVDPVPANPGLDGVLGTADDIPAVPGVQGTHIGTTLIVTCKPGWTCDLALTYVAAVPAKPGDDGELGTEDDIPAVPAHYDATFTPTSNVPSETAERPIRPRARRATVGTASVSRVFVPEDKNSDGEIEPGEGDWHLYVNGQPNADSAGHIDQGNTTSDDAQLEYSHTGLLRNEGISSVRTITQPYIPEPAPLACMVEWRAARSENPELGSNSYTEFCTDKELDDDARAREQYAADVDASYEQYQQQKEQLDQSGQPYYDCIPQAIWNELAHGPRCALVYP